MLKIEIPIESTDHVLHVNTKAAPTADGQPQQATADEIMAAQVLRKHIRSAVQEIEKITGGKRGMTTNQRSN